MQLIEINGLRSEGGNGILVQKGNIFTADSIEIAGVKFKHKPVLYSETGLENTIGNPIIKNCIVTLNFKNDELYLMPIPEARSTDGWNSFGFTAEYKNDKVLVASLFKGLSADKANLKVDDEIMAVNGQKFDCKTYCECMVALSKILEENTKLVLDIKSGETTKEITVTKDQVNYNCAQHSIFCCGCKRSTTSTFISLLYHPHWIFLTSTYAVINNNAHLHHYL